MWTIITLIFLIVLCEFILLKLKSSELYSFKLLIRMIEMFIVCTFILRKPIEIILKYYIFKGISFLTHYVGFIDIYEQASLFIIHSGESSISVFINYECLGAIEHVVYTLVLIIATQVSSIKRLIYIILGNIYIINANIIRILTVFFIVRSKGIESYKIAHMFWGRIIFFIFILVLYLFIFTRYYIKNGGKE